MILDSPRQIDHHPCICQPATPQRYIHSFPSWNEWANNIAHVGESWGRELICPAIQKSDSFWLNILWKNHKVFKWELLFPGPRMMWTPLIHGPQRPCSSWEFSQWIKCLPHKPVMMIWVQIPRSQVKIWGYSTCVCNPHASDQETARVDRKMAGSSVHGLACAVLNRDPVSNKVED